MYARNDLDRGHLVRRRDPVWGPPEVATRANADTFRYTNARRSRAGSTSPSSCGTGSRTTCSSTPACTRNGSASSPRRCSTPDDPPYRGIRVPLRFVKVAAWRPGDELATAGFVLDQPPELDFSEAARAELADRERERTPRAVAVPDLGPFRTFQVPVADVATLTGLAMPALVEADRLERPTPSRARRVPRGWREVTRPGRTPARAVATKSSSSCSPSGHSPHPLSTLT